MRAFFKDNDKIVINSMDHSEALVGKTFLSNLNDKYLKAEQRNDINDDFDGLVLTITDLPEVKPVYQYVDTQFIMEMEALDSTNTLVKLDVASEDKVIYDYDKDKLDLIIKFLEDIGCYDIEYTFSDGLSFKVDHIINVEYNIPKGLYLLHEPQSNNVYASNPITITFDTTEVKYEPPVIPVSFKVINPLELEVGYTLEDKNDQEKVYLQGIIEPHSTKDLEIEEGTYNLRVSAEGYEELVKELVITKLSEPQEFELTGLTKTEEQPEIPKVDPDTPEPSPFSDKEVTNSEGGQTNE